jgi:hypothetical protein
MVEYLCHNQTSFPEYTSNTSPDMFPQKTAYFQNGMTISIGHEGIDPDLARKLYK